jgi:hypothetical protein
MDGIDMTRVTPGHGGVTFINIFTAFVIQDILEKFYCFAQETPQLAMILPMVSKGVAAAMAEEQAKEAARAKETARG